MTNKEVEGLIKKMTPIEREQLKLNLPLMAGVSNLLGLKVDHDLLNFVQDRL